MTPEHWQRIETLYHATLACDPVQRAAFLDEACMGDKTLRGAVAELLAADDELAQQTGDFLAAPALVLEAQALAFRGQVAPMAEALSHYRIESRLGVGGMGEVWLARDTQLERPVALKILPAQFTADQQRLQRFVREAKAASALNHPNILTIYEIGAAATPTGHTHFIATEFIAGETLRQRLAGGPLEPAAALAIVTQIGAALATAHEAGIIHRDIKPENVMVRPDGLVKVLDFGLALIVEGVPQEAGHALTDTGTVMGTPRYMSPEQARGLRPDARTDIFSLGVVVYELLAGRTPFAGATAAEIFAALLDKEPVPLARWRNDLPAGVEQVISRALSKPRELRFQTIREFLAELEQTWQRWLEEDELKPTRQLQALPAASRSGRPPDVVKTPLDAVATVKPVAAPPARGKPRIQWLLALGAAALAAAAWLWGPALWGRAALGPVKTIPLLSEAGPKDHASFSPDGSQLVFSWNGGKKAETARDLYITLVGVGKPVQLTATPGDEWLAVWSPDGKFIAFHRGTGNYVIPALPGGGEERKLGEGGPGLSWSPDGKLLAVCSLSEPSDAGSIYLVAADTGERVRRLTTPAPPLRDSLPAFAPDGRHIAFIRNLTTSGREIFLVPVTGGEPRQLTHDQRPIIGLAWSENGQEIIFSSTRTGGRGLWRVPSSGGEPERIPVDGKNPTYPAIARSGHRLAYTDAYDDTNIYFAEATSATIFPAKFGPLQPLIMSTRDDHSPQFSPDGQQIAFVSSRTGSEEIYVCRRDGSQPRQLTHMDGPATGTPRWSPDGRWLAFDSRGAGSVDIYLVSAAGGPVRRLTSEPSYDATPSWSRDGRWLYFTSDRGENHISNLWRLPLTPQSEPAGPPMPVTHGGAAEGHESPDSKLVYFSKGQAKYGLWSAPVEGGEEKPVPALAQVGYWRSWGVGPQGVYFISKEATPQQTIRFVSFATGKTSALLTVDKEPLAAPPGLALSPDGRRLLYAQNDYATHDLLLMENFR